VTPTVTVKGLADSPIPPRPRASTASTGASATMIDTACCPAYSTSTRSPAARRPPTARAGSIGMLIARNPCGAARRRNARVVTSSPSAIVLPAIRPSRRRWSRPCATVASTAGVRVARVVRKSDELTVSPARISWAATSTTVSPSRSRRTAKERTTPTIPAIAIST
jgi:hypothetical protein